jgi:hypothetical protein
MASRLVQEKLAPLVRFELLEKATRLLRMASRRPPLPVVQQAQQSILRLEVPQEHWTEPIALRQKRPDWVSPRLRRASWRPPLPGMRQERATIRRALFVVPA